MWLPLGRVLQCNSGAIIIAMTYDVSVVIVNDYDAANITCVEQTRKTFTALTRQNFDERVEFIFVGSEQEIKNIPKDVLDIIPDLKVVPSHTDSSSHLKNVGFASATAEFVVVLDLDCVPGKHWLKSAVKALRNNPDAFAVTGKSVYEGNDLLTRTLCMLERCYVDPGTNGQTSFLEIDNYAFRKSMYSNCKFRDDIETITSCLCYFRTIKDAGYKIVYEPEMLVVHNFDLKNIEKDLRRNYGRGYYLSRKLNPRIRFAWFSKLGYFSIPLFFIALTALDWIRCLRLWTRWNLRFYEVPFAMLTAVAVRFLEMPGFVDGIKNRPVPNTGYK